MFGWHTFPFENVGERTHFLEVVCLPFFFFFLPPVPPQTLTFMYSPSCLLQPHLFLTHHCLCPVLSPLYSSLSRALFFYFQTKPRPLRWWGRGTWTCWTWTWLEINCPHQYGLRSFPSYFVGGTGRESREGGNAAGPNQNVKRK